MTITKTPRTDTPAGSDRFRYEPWSATAFVRTLTDMLQADPDPPVDGISGKEAGRILGIRELSVSRLVNQGVLPKTVRGQRFGLDRADVERVALERFRAPHPYWCTGGDAAEILGVDVTRVQELVDQGLVPAVQHAGRWYFRRHQLEVIASTPEAQAFRGTWGRGA